MKFRQVLSRQFKDVAARITPDNYNSELVLNEITESDIRPIFTSLYRNVGVEFARESYVSNKPKSAEQYEDTWTTYMNNYAQTVAGDRIVSITAETKRIVLKFIQATIDEGVTEGYGTDVIARNIQRVLSEKGVDIARWRAQRIARTEVVGASNVGAMEGARALGQPTQKIWISTRDNRTRGNKPTDQFDHISMDGKTIDMNDKFDVGGEMLDCPGDPAGSGGNIINCRCAVAFKVKRIA
jgi:hypothetical protein